jgi:hypothetical protein
LLDADILETDVQLTRTGNDLIVAIAGTQDTMAVTNYFLDDGANGHKVDQIAFASGTTWTYQDVAAQVNVTLLSQWSLMEATTDLHLSGSKVALGGETDSTTNSTQLVTLATGGSTATGGTIATSPGAGGSFGGLQDELLKAA